MDILNELLIISNELKLTDVKAELTYIQERINTDNKEIVIPIVGEFSSGKTTLINALTDGKKLETSSRPTTSVVYEILFGQNKEFAQLFKIDGEICNLEDISSIKNDDLSNIERIRIFDTSNKIDESTILVDTPGLSSNDSKHIEALSKYLPNADALILCIDANQQITNSLLEFLKINDLAHLPIYLVITKADTKSSSEIKGIKDYIAKNIKLSVDNIVAISSVKNELSEFYDLISKIQNSKNDIINNVLQHRLNCIKKYLRDYTENLLTTITTDKKIEKELKEQQRKLDKLSNSINILIEDTKSNVADIEYETIKEFSRVISNKLENIISKRTKDSDEQAIGVVNSTSNLVVENYQNEIRKNLLVLARQRKNTDLGIPLRSLESINVDEIEMSPLSYNIDLGSAGQSQIKHISNGLKIAAAIGAVVVTAGVAASAVGAAGIVGSAGVAKGAVVAVNAADTLTDVASIASNVSTQKKIANQIKNLPKYKNQIDTKLNLVNGYNMQAGQMIDSKNNQGFVENILGNVSDDFLGKPQRRRMVNDYMENSLIPEFKSKLKSISANLLRNIQEDLNTEAQFTIDQYADKLLELKQLSENESESFAIKITSYKKILVTLN